MTDFLQHSHDDYRNDLPEFALGILDGRQRAALLAHLETCPECTQMVQELTDASDALLHVPSGAEPPLGFESRIIDRIRSSQPTPSRWALRSWSSLAAAAALVLVSFGLGWVVDRGVSHSPAANSVALSNMDQRNLELNGHNVGSVVAYRGSPPWMFVTLDAPATVSSVRCTVVTTTGARQFVGTFALKNGEGSWGTSLPVAFTSVRNVQLTSSSGAVVANLAASTWSYPPSTH
ncbi:MAG TPA: zf-HC2 domain-containing protein [Acidimicrobiales bacterium]